MVNQRVGLFDLGSNPMDKVTFLFITLLSDEVQNEIKNVGGDSAQANISNGQIENIKIIYSQNSIIEKYNIFGAPVMNNILNKIEENQKLTEMKELLLSRLATEQIQ